ncbi:hypothetical protein N9L54_04845 [Porticoccaceae bacterium]|nr:hypothetical protein [Porticoccaceae bacterium]
MRVLTAKEVNFVSGGSIDGNQYSDPWVLSGDDQSSGSCSSSSSDASCSASASQSVCQTPSVGGGNSGYLGTGMPCTSGNSVGDVNYSPPTQEEACENAGNAIKIGDGLMATRAFGPTPIALAGLGITIVGTAAYVNNGCSGT